MPAVKFARTWKASKAPAKVRSPTRRTGTSSDDGAAGSVAEGKARRPLRPRPGQRARWRSPSRARPWGWDSGPTFFPANLK